MADRRKRVETEIAETRSQAGRLFTRAKAELDTALRLAPGSAEILTFYAGWASAFGEAERGAEMVDQVIRLDPNYDVDLRPLLLRLFYGGPL